MNDEANAPQPDDKRLALVGLFAGLIPSVGGIVMIVVIVLALLNAYIIEPRFCPAPTEPEGPHCADAMGNATCVDYYGVEQPYCNSSVVVFHGCVSKRPVPSDAAPCGTLTEGLPNDPTCAKVIVNHVPRPDVTPAMCRVMAVLDRLPWLIFTSLIVLCAVLAAVNVLVVPLIVRARAARERRARAAREQRARVVVASDSEIPKPSLPPPRVASDSQPEKNDQRS